MIQATIAQGCSVAPVTPYVFLNSKSTLIDCSRWFYRKYEPRSKLELDKGRFGAPSASEQVSSLRQKKHSPDHIFFLLPSTHHPGVHDGTRWPVVILGGDRSRFLRRGHLDTMLPPTGSGKDQASRYLTSLLVLCFC